MTMALAWHGCESHIGSTVRSENLCKFSEDAHLLLKIFLAFAPRQTRTSFKEDEELQRTQASTNVDTAAN
jgi:hypothetical protein